MAPKNPIGDNLGSSIAVREQTVSDADMFERTLENVHRLPARLVDSYRSRNAASYTLDPNLDVDQDYALMSYGAASKGRAGAKDTPCPRIRAH